MRLPDNTNRLSIVGATGSGKTQAALWHLSMRDIDLHPWVIYNFKNDKGIDGIPGKRDIGLDEVPAKPGVYVAHPHPDEIDDVERQLWGIWDKENCGVYVDEGYMIGERNPPFRAILTQGRSRHTPVIMLSQRPVWLDRFVFSESEFFQVFRLNHKKDNKAVQEFIPTDISKRLPEYHSYYYDVGANKTTVLKPVPDIDTIYKSFDRKLSKLRKTV